MIDAVYARAENYVIYVHDSDRDNHSVSYAISERRTAKSMGWKH